MDTNFIFLCCMKSNVYAHFRTNANVQAQLVTAAGMLRNGAEVVRLMSRKYQV